MNQEQVLAYDLPKGYSEKRLSTFIEKWQGAQGHERQGTPNKEPGGALSKVLEFDGQQVKVVYRRDPRKPGSYHVITVYWLGR